jgi:REP element-mobilizing transposase RayT
MSRPPRNWEPGGVYHVFSRGSDRRALFLCDQDRIDLLDMAATVVQRYEIECLAFALMTNHCHYLFRTPDTVGACLSNALRDLNGRYARRFNWRHRHEAHAFRNRFGAVLQVTEQQLLWTARYIVVNPVESGLCGHASEWPWTSYRATAGLEEPPAFLAVPALLSLFADKPETAVARYIDFVDAPPSAGV